MPSSCALHAAVCVSTEAAVKFTPYLFPVLVLILRRHAAAAWLLDTVGHPEQWLVVALATWSVVSIGVACAVLCAAVLAWNYVCNELPANRRKKAQP
jgi:hypothetical protein